MKNYGIFTVLLSSIFQTFQCMYVDVKNVGKQLRIFQYIKKKYDKKMLNKSVKTMVLFKLLVSDEKTMVYFQFYSVFFKLFKTLKIFRLAWFGVRFPILTKSHYISKKKKCKSTRFKYIQKVLVPH